MRKLLPIAILFLSFATTSAAQIVSILDGPWMTTSTWNLGRVPVIADSVVIATSVSVNDDQEMSALTVLSGGTLAGVAGDNKVLTVNSTLLNQGNIAQSGTDNDFRIFVFGDIINEGTLNVRRLRFRGSAVQNLSQSSGSTWLSTVYNSKTGGKLVAQTALDIAGDFDLIASTFRTLDMNGNDLIVSGSGTINNATVITSGRLVGRTASTPFARSTTFVGNPTIVETVRLGADVDIDSSLVVIGTLTGMKSSTVFTATVDIAGDLSNSGTIMDEQEGGRLRLRVHGNLRNANVWSATETVFMGPSDQNLHLSSGNKWSGGFSWEKSAGAVVATTNQIFAGSTRIDSLRMEGFDVAVSGTGTFLNNSRIIAPGTIQSIDGNEAFGTGTQILGNTVIQNRFSPGFQLTIVGDLTVTGTLESLRGGNTGALTTMTIDGGLTNRGTITDGPNGARLSLRVSGDVNNTGTWTTEGLELISAGSRTVSVPGISSGIFCGQRFASAKSGQILFVGKNAMPDVSVTGERTCAVLFGASLALDDAPSSLLQNFGSITVTRSSAGGLPNSEFYRSRATIGAGMTETVSVTHYGGQVPTSFGNAIPGWWRVSITGGSAQTELQQLTLNYSSGDLNGASVSDLLPLRSSDDGATWQPLGGGVGVSRENGKIVLSNAPAIGDYALSINGLPTEAAGGITAHIIGRRIVRAGRAPNRFTIAYSNRSNSPTGISGLVFRTNRFHHITQIVPSDRQPGTEPAIGPAAFSFPFVAEGTLAADSAAFIFVDALGPLETRTFEVVLTADPEAADLDDPVMTLDVFQSSVSGGNVTDDFIDDPVVARNAWEALALNWPYHERPVIPFIDTLIDQSNASGKTYSSPLLIGMLIRGVSMLAVPAACKIIGTFRQYQESRTRKQEKEIAALSTFYKNRVKQKYQLLPSDDSIAAFLKTQLSTSFSWLCETIGLSLDPNEKVGPVGVGDEQFISSAGRQTYQIFFENKAEATAPAFEIAIDDTLSSAFSASSVSFEGSSHDGWSISVDGNILRWFIQGIELPPNVNPPEGEGYVRFSVDPVAGLPSGTVLSNRATITFDLNDPILTNTFSNTLDFGVPKTTMIPLPETVSADTISIRWQAADGPSESGVMSTTVFASRDGGRFETVGESFTDSLSVAVAAGHVYRFYALSQDAVGNVEKQRPAVVTTRAVSGVATEDEAIPFVFELDANYPNPFNPVTTIEYTLPSPGSVRLDVFDVTGRLVATLLDSSLSAGRHSVTWDARNAASGVYFYRLSQGKNLKTIPMVLLK